MADSAAQIHFSWAQINPYSIQGKKSRYIFSDKLWTMFNELTDVLGEVPKRIAVIDNTSGR